MWAGQAGQGVAARNRAGEGTTVECHIFLLAVSPDSSLDILVPLFAPLYLSSSITLGF